MNKVEAHAIFHRLRPDIADHRILPGCYLCQLDRSTARHRLGDVARLALAGNRD